MGARGEMQKPSLNRPGPGARVSNAAADAANRPNSRMPTPASSDNHACASGTSGRSPSSRPDHNRTAPPRKAMQKNSAKRPAGPAPAASLRKTPGKPANTELTNNSQNAQLAHTTQTPSRSPTCNPPRTSQSSCSPRHQMCHLDCRACVTLIVALQMSPFLAFLAPPMQQRQQRFLVYRELLQRMALDAG